MADKKTEGFSDAEKAAMKERAKELREAAKIEKNRAAGEKAIEDKIAEMPAADQKIAKGFHALVAEVAPDLVPRTMYGMPAYSRDGKVLVMLQASSKFETRYCSFVFEDNANLDDGPLWPTGFAITEWSDAVRERIRALLAQAIS